MKKFLVLCLALVLLSFCFVGCGNSKYFEVVEEEITETRIYYHLQFTLPEDAAFYSSVGFLALPMLEADSEIKYEMCDFSSDFAEKKGSIVNTYISYNELNSSSVLPKKLKFFALYVTPKTAEKFNIAYDEISSLFLVHFDKNLGFDYKDQYFINDEPVENYLKYLTTHTYTITLPKRG